MCISSSYYKTGRLKQHFRRPRASRPAINASIPIRPLQVAHPSHIP
ncbi:hypothetical protein [Neisseria sicca]|nr:hypothetical protein [Neisseria sicca]